MSFVSLVSFMSLVVFVTIQHHTDFMHNTKTFPQEGHEGHERQQGHEATSSWKSFTVTTAKVQQLFKFYGYNRKTIGSSIVRSSLAKQSTHPHTRMP